VSEINVAQPALSQGSATVPGMGHLLGYARVSTTDQHPQLQVDALERAGCYRVFTETASGTRAGPPSSSSWTNCVPVTPSSCGNWIGWVGHCGTWSTPSLDWLSAG
jgi:hypothetical protein